MEVISLSDSNTSSRLTLGKESAIPNSQLVIGESSSESSSGSESGSQHEEETDMEPFNALEHNLLELVVTGPISRFLVAEEYRVKTLDNEIGQSIPDCLLNLKIGTLLDIIAEPESSQIDEERRELVTGCLEWLSKFLPKDPATLPDPSILPAISPIKPVADVLK